MRLKSKTTLTIKEKTFGDDKMLVCLPLVSKNIELLISQAKELMELNPDVIEWRVDFFDTVEDIDSVVKALIELNNVTGKLPLIFTCRHAGEGGYRELSQEKRIEIIEAALNTGFADIIDVEMFNDEEFLSIVKNLVIKHNSKLILSHHNFKVTPSEDFIYNKIIEGEKLGADISKIAVMPNDFGDVLNLLNATYKARNAIKIPLITMSMGEIGKITRIVGGIFGSDMSFAVGKEASAPGQVPIKDLVTILDIIE